MKRHLVHWTRRSRPAAGAQQATTQQQAFAWGEFLVVNRPAPCWLAPCCMKAARRYRPELPWYCGAPCDERRRAGPLLRERAPGRKVMRPCGPDMGLGQRVI